MTNQEWMGTLTAEQFYSVMHYLFFEYGLMYNSTSLAIIQWLGEEHE